MSSIFRAIGGTELVEVRREPVRLEKTGDRQTDAIQANLMQALDPVFTFPLLGANVFRDVAFTSGTPVVLAHRLGRRFIDAIVCVPSGALSQFRRIAQVPPSLDDVQVTLQSDVTTVASVLVF